MAHSNRIIARTPNERRSFRNVFIGVAVALAVLLPNAIQSGIAEADEPKAPAGLVDVSVTQLVRDDVNSAWVQGGAGWKFSATGNTDSTKETSTDAKGAGQFEAPLADDGSLSLQPLLSAKPAKNAHFVPVQVARETTEGTDDDGAEDATWVAASCLNNGEPVELPKVASENGQFATETDVTQRIEGLSAGDHLECVFYAEVEQLPKKALETGTATVNVHRVNPDDKAQKKHTPWSHNLAVAAISDDPYVRVEESDEEGELSAEVRVDASGASLVSIMPRPDNEQIETVSQDGANAVCTINDEKIPFVDSPLPGLRSAVNLSDSGIQVRGLQPDDVVDCTYQVRGDVEVPTTNTPLLNDSGQTRAAPSLLFHLEFRLLGPNDAPNGYLNVPNTFTDYEAAGFSPNLSKNANVVIGGWGSSQGWVFGPWNKPFDFDPQWGDWQNTKVVLGFNLKADYWTIPSYRTQLADNYNAGRNSSEAQYMQCDFAQGENTGESHEFFISGTGINGRVRLKPEQPWNNAPQIDGGGPWYTTQDQKYLIDRDGEYTIELGLRCYNTVSVSTDWKVTGETPYSASELGYSTGHLEITDGTYTYSSTDGSTGTKYTKSDGREVWDGHITETINYNPAKDKSKGNCHLTDIGYDETIASRTGGDKHPKSPFGVQWLNVPGLPLTQQAPSPIKFTVPLGVGRNTIKIEHRIECDAPTTTLTLDKVTIEADGHVSNTPGWTFNTSDRNMQNACVDEQGYQVNCVASTGSPYYSSAEMKVTRKGWGDIQETLLTNGDDYQVLDKVTCDLPASDWFVYKEGDAKKGEPAVISINFDPENRPRVNCTFTNKWIQPKATHIQIDKKEWEVKTYGSNGALKSTKTISDSEAAKQGYQAKPVIGPNRWETTFGTKNKFENIPGINKEWSLNDSLYIGENTSLNATNGNACKMTGAKFASTPTQSTASVALTESGAAWGTNWNKFNSGDDNNFKITNYVSCYEPKLECPYGTFSVSHSPTSSQIVGNTFTITAQLASGSGATVKLTLDSGLTLSAGNATQTVPASGIVTWTVTSSTAKTYGYKVEITDGKDGWKECSSTSVSGNLTFTAKPPEPTGSVVVEKEWWKDHSKVGNHTYSPVTIKVTNDGKTQTVTPGQGYTVKPNTQVTITEDSYTLPAGTRYGGVKFLDATGKEITKNADGKSITLSGVSADQPAKVTIVNDVLTQVACESDSSSGLKTTLTASPNPADEGKNVTFTLTVRDSAGNPVQGAKFKLYVGSTTWPTLMETNSNGVATKTVGALANGTYSARVVFMEGTGFEKQRDCATTSVTWVDPNAGKPAYIKIEKEWWKDSSLLGGYNVNGANVTIKVDGVTVTPGNSAAVTAGKTVTVEETSYTVPSGTDYWRTKIIVNGNETIASKLDVTAPKAGETLTVKVVNDVKTTPVIPQTGSVTVSKQWQDANGNNLTNSEAASASITVTVAGKPQTITGNGSVTFTGVASGNQTVTESDLKAPTGYSNPTAVGSTSKNVNVETGKTVSTSFTNKATKNSTSNACDAVSFVPNKTSLYVDEASTLNMKVNGGTLASGTKITANKTNGLYPGSWTSGGVWDLPPSFVGWDNVGPTVKYSVAGTVTFTANIKLQTGETCTKAASVTWNDKPVVPVGPVPQCAEMGTGAWGDAITVSPSTQTVGNNVTVTAKILDLSDKPISGVQVKLFAGGKEVGAQKGTDSSGKASWTITGDKAGSVTYILRVVSVPGNTDPTVTDQNCDEASVTWTDPKPEGFTVTANKTWRISGELVANGKSYKDKDVSAAELAGVFGNAFKFGPYSAGLNGTDTIEWGKSKTYSSRDAFSGGFWVDETSVNNLADYGCKWNKVFTQKGAGDKNYASQFVLPENGNYTRGFNVGSGYSANGTSLPNSSTITFNVVNAITCTPPVIEPTDGAVTYDTKWVISGNTTKWPTGTNTNEYLLGRGWPSNTVAPRWSPAGNSDWAYWPADPTPGVWGATKTLPVSSGKVSLGARTYQSNPTGEKLSALPEGCVWNPQSGTSAHKVVRAAGGAETDQYWYTPGETAGKVNITAGDNKFLLVNYVKCDDPAVDVTVTKTWQVEGGSVLSDYNNKNANVSVTGGNFSKLGQSFEVKKGSAVTVTETGYDVPDGYEFVKLTIDGTSKNVNQAYSKTVNENATISVVNYVKKKSAGTASVKVTKDWVISGKGLIVNGTHYKAGKYSYNSEVGKALGSKASYQTQGGANPGTWVNVPWGDTGVIALEGVTNTYWTELDNSSVLSSYNCSWNPDSNNMTSEVKMGTQSANFNPTAASGYGVWLGVPSDSGTTTVAYTNNIKCETPEPSCPVTSIKTSVSPSNGSVEANGMSTYTIIAEVSGGTSSDVPTLKFTPTSSDLVLVGNAQQVGRKVTWQVKSSKPGVDLGYKVEVVKTGGLWDTCAVSTTGSVKFKETPKCPVTALQVSSSPAGPLVADGSSTYTITATVTPAAQKPTLRLIPNDSSKLKITGSQDVNSSPYTWKVTSSTPGTHSFKVVIVNGGKEVEECAGVYANGSVTFKEPEIVGPTLSCANSAAFIRSTSLQVGSPAGFEIRPRDGDNKFIKDAKVTIEAPKGTSGMYDLSTPENNGPLWDTKYISGTDPYFNAYIGSREAQTVTFTVVITYGGASCEIPLGASWIPRDPNRLDCSLSKLVADYDRKTLWRGEEVELWFQARATGLTTVDVDVKITASGKTFGGYSSLSPTGPWEDYGSDIKKRIKSDTVQNVTFKAVATDSQGNKCEGQVDVSWVQHPVRMDVQWQYLDGEGEMTPITTAENGVLKSEELPADRAVAWGQTWTSTPYLKHAATDGDEIFGAKDAVTWKEGVSQDGDGKFYVRNDKIAMRADTSVVNETDSTACKLVSSKVVKVGSDAEDNSPNFVEADQSYAGKVSKPSTTTVYTVMNTVTCPGGVQMDSKWFYDQGEDGDVVDLNLDNQTEVVADDLGIEELFGQTWTATPMVGSTVVPSSVDGNERFVAEWGKAKVKTESGFYLTPDQDLHMGVVLKQEDEESSSKCSISQSKLVKNNDEQLDPAHDLQLNPDYASQFTPAGKRLVDQYHVENVISCSQPTPGEGQLKWQKVDAANAETRLGGSEWVIVGTGEDNSDFSLVVTDCIGVEATTGQCAGPDEDPGLGSFLVTLPEGDYLLRETEAPLGFKLNDTQYPFTVVSGQVVTPQASWDDGKIPNERINVSVTLPLTGEKSLLIILLGGLALIGVAIWSRRSAGKETIRV